MTYVKLDDMWPLSEHKRGPIRVRRARERVQRPTDFMTATESIELQLDEEDFTFVPVHYVDPENSIHTYFAEREVVELLLKYEKQIREIRKALGDE